MKRRFTQLLEDFWLGNQFCSLVFSLSSLVIIFCLWRDGSGNCEVESHWSLPFVLNVFPSFIRFIQCVRRYIDSRLYLLPILYVVEISWFAASWSNLCCLLHSRILIISLQISMGEHTKLRWIVFYHLQDVQDLLMDWSIMDPHARHPLLRQNLIYTDAIPVSG